MSRAPCANARLRISMPSGADRIVEFHLDGWPLLLVDLEAGCIRANDLRAHHAYSHVGHLTGGIGNPAVDTGTGGDEHSIVVAIGPLIGFIHLDPARPTHAAVRAVQMERTLSHPEALLLDCEVRYRQLPREPAALRRQAGAGPN